MEKQNKILKIIIVILAVIIVLGICAGIALFVKYDNANKEKTEISNVQNITNTTDNTEKIETNKTETKVVSYKELDGLYKYKKDANDYNSEFYYLNLYENGTFTYRYGQSISSGIAGNYIVRDDNIVLNKLFNFGTDTSITATNGTITVKLNNDGTITDTNKLVEMSSVTLTKANNDTENNRAHMESNIFDLINTSIVINKASSESTLLTEETNMTADEKYAIYSRNTQNKIKSLGLDGNEGNTFYNQKNVHSTEEFPFVGSHINEKLEAYVNVKETGDHVKILDNAIDCGICLAGNGGTTYLIWAIDINGNLYTQNYDTTDTANRMKINLTKKQGVKNIISVIQCVGVSAYYPLAVDIEGNSYQL